jgi:hypothetical protein
MTEEYFWKRPKQMNRAPREERGEVWVRRRKLWAQVKRGSLPVRMFSKSYLQWVLQEWMRWSGKGYALENQGRAKTTGEVNGVNLSRVFL